MALPIMLSGRRTAAGVAAYFDLITDEGRLFYGDSFHFGYFRTGSETLAQALDAHTDLVAERARLTGAAAHPRRRLRARRARGTHRSSGTAARSRRSTSAASRSVRGGN